MPYSHNNWGVGFSRRHLRNLKTLGHKNFVLYRTSKSTLPDDEILDIPVEYDLAKALAHKPIATIIANPTALHISFSFASSPLRMMRDHGSKDKQG